MQWNKLSHVIELEKNYLLSLYRFANSRFFFLSNFLAKSEPLEEEKEAFDDPEKGKLAEDTKTPEKKSAEVTETKKTETETGENKEERKSNGAHTPV